jgi:fatty acid desaturase
MPTTVSSPRRQRDIPRGQGVFAAVFALILLWLYHLWLYGVLLGIVTGLVPATATGFLVFVGIRCRLPLH